MVEIEAAETPDGPFRTAELTPEARLDKERVASFARVHRATAEAMELEVRRTRWLDALGWAVVAVAVAALATVLVLAAASDDASWLAWLCPATAFAISAGVHLRYRQVVGRRRAERAR